MSLERRYVEGEGWQTVAADRAQRQTATVTTDQDTFEALHVLDLGRPAAAYVTATVLSADLDGEEWGTGTSADENAGLIAVDVESILQSSDGETWTATNGYDLSLSQTVNPWMRDVQWRGGVGLVSLDRPEHGVGALPLLTHEMVGVAARYVRIKGRVVDSFLLTTYEGVNHPSAIFRFDVEYA